MLRRLLGALFKKNTITKERAMEILAKGSKEENWDEIATPDEVRVVCNYWEDMDEGTCWLDALKRIAVGKS